MYCRRIFLYLILSVIAAGRIFSQADSTHLQVSLLTCSAGEQLYSTFGHSALRIVDSLNNDDIVYNYGTFNFEEPGFYTKFIRGKLQYYLSTSDYDEFKLFYAEEGRGITEQVLNLTPNEKVKINRLLHQNLLDENRFYKYDFLFDNCTTRLRDLVENAIENKIAYGKVLEKPATFRNLIHESLHKNNKLWSKLGIDLLLGSNTDAVMQPREIMFLPDYLMHSFDKALIPKQPLVLSSTDLLTSKIEIKGQSFLLTPLFIFSFIVMLLLIPGFYSTLKMHRLAEHIDGLIFFITGLVGLLLIVMWAGTDHVMCRNNYNLLWALPTHLYAAFQVNTTKPTHRQYFKIVTYWYILILIVWAFLPQQMNIAFLPFVLFLLYRSYKIGFSNNLINR